MRLTKRQKEVLEMVRESFGQHGYDSALENMRQRAKGKAQRKRHAAKCAKLEAEYGESPVNL